MFGSLLNWVQLIWSNTSVLPRIAHASYVYRGWAPKGFIFYSPARQNTLNLPVQRLPTRFNACWLTTTMSWLTNVALYVIHLVYLFINALSFLRKSFTRQSPRPLDAARSQTPKHLALVFNTGDYNSKHSSEELDDFLVENVGRVVSWCRSSGITRLTVYDREGMRSLGLSPSQFVWCLLCPRYILSMLHLIKEASRWRIEYSDERFGRRDGVGVPSDATFNRWIQVIIPRPWFHALAPRHYYQCESDQGETQGLTLGCQTPHVYL